MLEDVFARSWLWNWNLAITLDTTAGGFYAELLMEDAHFRKLFKNAEL